MPEWSEWPQEEKDQFLRDVAQAGTTAKSVLEAAGRLAKRTLGES